MSLPLPLLEVSLASGQPVVSFLDADQLKQFQFELDPENQKYTIKLDLLKFKTALAEILNEGSEAQNDLGCSLGENFKRFDLLWNPSEWWRRIGLINNETQEEVGLGGVSFEICTWLGPLEIENDKDNNSNPVVDRNSSQSANLNQQIRGTSTTQYSTTSIDSLDLDVDADDDKTSTTSFTLVLQQQPVSVDVNEVEHLQNLLLSLEDDDDIDSNSNLQNSHTHTHTHQNKLLDIGLLNQRFSFDNEALGHPDDKSDRDLDRICQLLQQQPLTQIQEQEQEQEQGQLVQPQANYNSSRSRVWLRKLNIQWSEMSHSFKEERLLKLSKALQQNYTLTELSLSCIDLEGGKNSDELDELGVDPVDALRELMKTLSLSGGTGSGYQQRSITKLSLSRFRGKSWGHNLLKEWIPQILKGNRNLVEFSLARSDLRGPEGQAAASALIAVADALKVNKTLRSLELKRSMIGASGVIALADALKVNWALTSLTLFEYLDEHDQEGKLEAARAICEALKVNKTLTSLKLRGNCFWSIQELDLLVQALKVNQTLSSLSLIGKWGTEAEAKASSWQSWVLLISELLKTKCTNNRTLSTFTLELCHIDNRSDGGIPFVRLENQKLTSLTLYGLGDKYESLHIVNQALTGLRSSMSFDNVKVNANAILEALKANQTLTEVSLENCLMNALPDRMGDVGNIAPKLEIITDMLKNNLNQTLTCLSLNSCEFGDGFFPDAIAFIAKALQENRTLKELDLTYWDTDCQRAALIADALIANKANSKLSALNLSGSYISTEGALSLAEAFAGSGALMSLNLEYNETEMRTGEGGKALAKALSLRVKQAEPGVRLAILW